MIRSSLIHFFLAICLILLCTPAFAQTEEPQPEAPPAQAADREQPAKRTPRTYFLPGDTLDDEELLEYKKEREKSEQELLDELEALIELEDLGGRDKLRALEALDALESLEMPSVAAREALLRAQEQLQGYIIGVPGAPNLPGIIDPGMEYLLPDTVYTTEITIGPTGIEFYDTSGTPTLILGQPTKPDEWFLPGEGDLITTKHSADIIQIGTDVQIDHDERVEGNVIVFGGNIEVFGEVKGDAVAILGDVHVDGYVLGSAVAPLGQVNVASTGKVRKDVIGGSIVTHPGSIVGGKKEYTSVNLPARPEVFHGVYLAVFFTYLGVSVFLIFLTLLAHAFAGKNIKMVSTRIAESGVKSFFVGLVSMILGIPLAFVLLVITVIGIPVAVLVLPLAVFLAKILGFAAVGLRFGGKLSENTIFRAKSQLAQTLIGTSALLFITLFGATLVIIPATPVQVIGWIIFGVGFAISFIATTTGIGAVVLTRFGTRLHKNDKAPTTPPSTKPLPPSSIQPGPSAA